MDVYQCEAPEGFDYDKCELEDYELKSFRAAEIEAVYYWYGSGGYEGAGQALLLKDGKWAVHDMGHCSCYGPTDHFSAPTEQWYDSLDSIPASGTEIWYADVRPLIEAARKHV